MVIDSSNDFFKAMRGPDSGAGGDSGVAQH
jgi:hypothetical protein